MVRNFYVQKNKMARAMSTKSVVWFCEVEGNLGGAAFRFVFLGSSIAARASHSPYVSVTTTLCIRFNLLYK